MRRGAMDEGIAEAESRLFAASKEPCNASVIEIVTTTGSSRDHQQRAPRLVAAVVDPEEEMPPLGSTCRCKGFVFPDVASVCKGLRARRARGGEDLLGMLLCLGCGHELLKHRRLSDGEAAAWRTASRGRAAWVSHGMIPLPVKGPAQGTCPHQEAGANRSGRILSDGCKVAATHDAAGWAEAAALQRNHWAAAQLTLPESIKAFPPASASSPPSASHLSSLLTPPACRLANGCPTSASALPGADPIAWTFRSGQLRVSCTGQEDAAWSMEGRGGALLCCAWVVYGDAIAVAAGGEDETIALVSFDRGPEGRQGKLGGQVAFLDGHTSFVTDVQCAGELKSSRERKGGCTLVSCSMDMRLIMWAVYPGRGLADSTVLSVVGVGCQLTCLLPCGAFLSPASPLLSPASPPRHGLATDQCGSLAASCHADGGGGGDDEDLLVVGVVSRTWSVGVLQFSV